MTLIRSKATKITDTKIPQTLIYEYKCQGHDAMKAMLIGITAILLAGLGIIYLFTNMNNGSHSIDRRGIIPPIDVSAPTVTETATFSLG